MLLLTTKLYIPPLRPELVSRPRLCQQLDAGLHRKLTLISAPAGSGKTTLLSAWIHGKQSGAVSFPVAWLSLDEGDNDLVRFLTYIVAALQSIEGFEDIGQGVLNALQTPQPPFVEALLTTLTNEIAAAAITFVLILDDYHTIRAQTVHDALSFLLDHLPPQAHLVIATRTDPPLPVARLRGRGQVTELRQVDLRFRPDEVATFLRGSMDVALPADEVAALTSRTEGWIAGLQMAAVSMQGRDDVVAFIRSFTGSNRYVLDYLVEEVLHRQPQGIQAFWLHTAILDRMTGPLCDAVVRVLHIEDPELILDVRPGQALHPGPEAVRAQQVLEYLERANLFVVPLDDRREWYRYHHLFADLLRKHLYQTSPELVPVLHSRASAWYEAHGLVGPAIEHALDAGDVDRAAALIEDAAESVMLRSEVATLHTWLAALPKAVIRARPLLCVYYALALLLSGHPLDQVEARLQALEAAEIGGAVLGAVIGMRALIAAYQQKRPESLALARRALALLPEDNLFFRSFITGYQGMLYMYSGDVQAATEALEASTRIGQAAGNITITVLGLCHLAELAMIEGQLHRAKVLYERALALGEDDQGRLQPIAGMAVMGLGKLDLVWHELDAAEQHLTEGIELTHRWGEVGTIGGYVGLARIKQARGDIDAARALIQEAQRLAEKFDAMEADDVYVAVNRARLAISQGDFESALGWLRSRDLRDALDPAEFAGGPADTSVPYNRVSEYMLLAEIYGAQGQAGKALKILEPLLALSEAAGWTILVLRLLVLEVLAFDAQGDRERAVACLTRALVLGEPEEHMWAFLEGVQHEEVGALLRHVAEQGVSPGYVASILAKLGEEAPALASADTAQAEAQPPAPGSAPSSPPLVDPLTEREREVLQLLTSSLSSTEMAEQLFISVNTVRSHVRSIYGKLDVHSRYEAVDRAKALGLL